MSGRTGTVARRLALMVVILVLTSGAYWLGSRHRHPVRAVGVTEPKQLWTCGMHPEIIRDEPGLCPICHMKLTPLVATGTSTGGGAATAVVIDPVVVQNMGLRVAEARRGPIKRRLRATAYLDQAEPNIHDVSLRVSGWIETLHADTVGMHIAAGAPLFELYSPEVQVAVEELIAGRRLGTPNDAAVESVPASSRALLLHSTRRKLELYGLSADQIERLSRLDKAPRTVTFLSPATGHVTEKFVVAGSAVKAGERLVQIVDHSTLWLDVQVHAQDLPAVQLGQTMTATVEGATQREVQGVIIFMHPHVDPATRTATVRARIANPELTLRPGMYATAQIDSGSTPEAVLVPREAVIDTGRRQVVFVAIGGGKFEPRAVTVGVAGDDGLVEILLGIAVGERVVISGQFLLDAESRMQEAIRKHLADGLLAEQP